MPTNGEVWNNQCSLVFQEEEQPGEVEVENVRVVVRVRPLDANELQQDSQNVVTVDKISRAITVLKPNAGAGEPPKVYYFDNVFGEESSQVRNTSIRLCREGMAEGID